MAEEKKWRSVHVLAQDMLFRAPNSLIAPSIAYLYARGAIVPPEEAGPLLTGLGLAKTAYMRLFDEAIEKVLQQVEEARAKKTG